MEDEKVLLMGQCQEKEEELRNLHELLKGIREAQGIKESQVIKQT
jgi:hypothetical protein